MTLYELFDLKTGDILKHGLEDSYWFVHANWTCEISHDGLFKPIVIRQIAMPSGTLSEYGRAFGVNVKGGRDALMKLTKLSINEAMVLKL